MPHCTSRIFLEFRIPLVFLCPVSCGRTSLFVALKLPQCPGVYFSTRLSPRSTSSNSLAPLRATLALDSRETMFSAFTSLFNATGPRGVVPRASHRGVSPQEGAKRAGPDGAADVDNCGAQPRPVAAASAAPRGAGVASHGMGGSQNALKPTLPPSVLAFFGLIPEPEQKPTTRAEERAQQLRQLHADMSKRGEVVAVSVPREPMAARFCAGVFSSVVDL